MKNKELKIEVPQGYEIDKEKSTFEKIVFKIVEKELPKSWEDLKIISGFYVNGYSKVETFGIHDVKEENKNIFPSEEEAKACLALAQLCQLRDRYNDGWKPDWENGFTTKWCFTVEKNNIRVDVSYLKQEVLNFKTQELRDKFLENFRDLIEVAKPLL